MLGKLETVSMDAAKIFMNALILSDMSYCMMLAAGWRNMKPLA